MSTATPVLTDEVLEAFGLSTGQVIQRLCGGTGRSVRVGDHVLKPADNAPIAEWSCQVLADIEPRGFRVPRPLRSADGCWVAGGWTAAALVPGDPIDRAARLPAWADLLAASRAFHRALRRVPRPDLLDSRTDRWAVGDRVAWGEQSIEPLPPTAPLLDRLLSVLDAPGPASRGSATATADQLIHGDLSGNVLLADGLPPAVIDFSPYWRPSRYADAIVVVDGLLWLGADGGLIQLAAGGADFPRLLARAVVFRLVALDGQAREVGPSCLGELALFAPVVSAVERLVAASGRSR